MLDLTPFPRCIGAYIKLVEKAQQTNSKTDWAKANEAAHKIIGTMEEAVNRYKEGIHVL